MLKNIQSRHKAKPRSESPTSSTACTGMDALSQRSICKPSSPECSPLLHLASASAQLASAHLRVSGHTAFPLENPAVFRSVAQLCPRALPAPCGFHLVAHNLHARVMFYLDLYSQGLVHCGYLNTLAELVGVTPELPKQYWNCFLKMQLCP